MKAGDKPASKAPQEQSTHKAIHWHRHTDGGPTLLLQSLAEPEERGVARLLRGAVKRRVALGVEVLVHRSALGAAQYWQRRHRRAVRAVLLTSSAAGRGQLCGEETALLRATTPPVHETSAVPAKLGIFAHRDEWNERRIERIRALCLDPPRALLEERLKQVCAATGALLRHAIGVASTRICTASCIEGVRDARQQAQAIRGHSC